jgi:hypothetical protein
MEIHTNETPPIVYVLLFGLVVLALVAVAVLAGSGNLQLIAGADPESLAAAQIIEQTGAQATAQALEIQRQQADLALSAEARQLDLKTAEQIQASQRLQALANTAAGAGVVAIGAITLGLVVLALVLISYWIRRYRLPAARQIAPGVIIIESPHGAQVVDLATGRVDLPAGRRAALAPLNADRTSTEDTRPVIANQYQPEITRENMLPQRGEPHNVDWS